jgi:hypothetical protein
MRLLLATAEAVGANLDGWGEDYEVTASPRKKISGALPGLLI